MLLELFDYSSSVGHYVTVTAGFELIIQNGLYDNRFMK